MWKPKVADCYEVDKVYDLGVKIHIFETLELQAELYWRNFPKRNTSIVLSQYQYRWLLYCADPPEGIIGDMRVTKNEELKDLVMEKENAIGSWEIVGHMTYHGWKRLQTIIEYTMNDVSHVAPYCFNDGYRAGTDNNKMLQQILITMASRRYHMMLSERCRQCMNDNNFHLNYKLNDCRSCHYGRFDIQYIGHDESTCIINNPDECKNLAKKALLSVQLLELAVVVFVNNLRNKRMYFTSQMEYKGVNMALIIGFDLDKLVDVIVKGRYYYPLSDSLIRKLTQNQMGMPDYKCTKCVA